MLLRPLYARTIAVDSSGFIALVDTADKNHESAVQLLADVQRLRLPLVTTVPAVHETYRHLLYQLGRARARAFLSAVLDGSITIDRTTPADDARALQLLNRYADVNLSSVDAVTMAVMERLQIASVFSFDDDYFMAGFIRVPPLAL